VRTALLAIALAASCGRAKEPAPSATPTPTPSPAQAPTPIPIPPPPPLPTPPPTPTTSATLLPCDGSARALAPGLVHERWPIEATPAIPAEACLDLVRADLAQLRLRIVTQSRDGAARPAPDWLADLQLVAATNAGMFLEGGRSIGLLVDGVHVDQRRDNPKLGGFLAFDPREPGAPPVVIAGRDCPGFDLADLRARYRSIAQSYRLLGCDGGAIPWADEKSYSAAAIAVDRAGRVVFVHVRAPFRMAEIARALADPRLALTAAMFVEGGPEATLAVAGDHPLRLVGSFETGFVENDGNLVAWALPNLIALARR
jgi:hypothetical protein